MVTRPVMLNMSLHHFCLYCPKPILVALMLPLIRSKCKCVVQFTQRSQVSEVVWCCYTLSCVAPSHWLHAVNVSKEVCRSPILKIDTFALMVTFSGTISHLDITTLPSRNIGEQDSIHSALPVHAFAFRT